MIIAFTGFAGSGKDTAALVLVEEYGFQRIAFADKMREAMYELNPIVGVRSMSGVIVSVRDLVDKEGWDDAKRNHPEIRRLLQVYGTECGRDVFGANCWVDLAMRKASQFENVVFTDCRFENEAEAIRKAGGIVVRITRPGVVPVNGHVSDKGLSDTLVDETIANDGTVDDLRDAIHDLAHRMGVR